MSDVRPTNSANTAVTVPAVKPASTPVAGNLDPSTGKAKISAADKIAEAIVAAPEEAQSSRVDEAVSRLNEYVQSTQRDLYFNYDEGSNKTIVTVKDRKTDEVIRQIPNEVALQLAEQLSGDEPLRLFSAQA